MVALDAEPRRALGLAEIDGDGPAAADRSSVGAKVTVPAVTGTTLVVVSVTVAVNVTDEPAPDVKEGLLLRAHTGARVVVEGTRRRDVQAPG